MANKKGFKFADFIRAGILTIGLQCVVSFFGYFLLFAAASPNYPSKLLWLLLIIAPPVFISIKFFYKSKRYKEMIIFLIVIFLIELPFIINSLNNISPFY